MRARHWWLSIFDSRSDRYCMRCQPHHRNITCFAFVAAERCVFDGGEWRAIIIEISGIIDVSLLRCIHDVLPKYKITTPSILEQSLISHNKSSPIIKDIISIISICLAIAWQSLRTLYLWYVLAFLYYWRHGMRIALRRRVRFAHSTIGIHFYHFVLASIEASCIIYALYKIIKYYQKHRKISVVTWPCCALLRQKENNNTTRKKIICM